MSEADAETNHWAILIGVNFYQKEPLKGCVRDVELMKFCLENYLNTGSKRPRIVTLTATTPENPDSCYPIETPDSWPTYGNVTSSLENTTAQANPGDFVYIHYSGHGTKEPSEGSNNNQNSGDLALVLFDLAKGSCYLKGRDLANRLNDMVKKGLLVTLVLDCCFSGSVVRHSSPHNNGIRTIPYDAAIDAAYPREPHGYPSHWVGSSLRDATLPEWLINPDRIESGKAAGKKHGALSFFLAFTLLSLWKGGTEITHQSLYRHLRVQFHVNWPTQTPMRYGNKQLSFFGKPRPGLDAAFIPVLKISEHNRLQLGAGHAHGVYESDEFAVYPFDSPDDASIEMRNDFLKFKVETVRGLTSDLVGIEPISNMHETRHGWKARLLTSLSSRKVPVRLLPTVGDRTQWIAAMEQRRFLALSTEDVEEQPCRNITCLPTIPSCGREALNHVVDILEHLATFKYFEGIDNRIPNVPFEDSFKLHLADEDARDLGETGMIDAKEEDVLSLTVENLGDHSLYVAIFDLGPEWQIDSLLCQAGGGGFTVVPPKRGSCSSKEEVKWSMSVPESLKRQGVYYCDDVLKVFVTSRPSWFAPMLLPKVSVSDRESGGSVRSDYDRLSAFLSGLSTSLRGGDDFPEDAWAAHNFVIRTTTKG